MVAARCGSCHGAVPSGGAPMPLNTLDALRAPSMADSSVTSAERSLLRMTHDAAPMPPAPGIAATPAEVAALETWMAQGMPACSAPGDGGTPAVTKRQRLRYARLDWLHVLRQPPQRRVCAALRERVPRTRWDGRANNRQVSNLFNSLGHAFGDPAFDHFGLEFSTRIAPSPLSELYG